VRFPHGRGKSIAVLIGTGALLTGCVPTSCTPTSVPVSVGGEVMVDGKSGPTGPEIAEAPVVTVPADFGTGTMSFTIDLKGSRLVDTREGGGYPCIASASAQLLFRPSGSTTFDEIWRSIGTVSIRDGDYANTCATGIGATQLTVAPDATMRRILAGFLELGVPVGIAVRIRSADGYETTRSCRVAREGRESVEAKRAAATDPLQQALYGTLSDLGLLLQYNACSLNPEQHAERRGIFTIERAAASSGSGSSAGSSSTTPTPTPTPSPPRAPTALGTVVVDYSSYPTWAVTPASLTGIPGDTFGLQNNRNNDNGPSYVSLVDGTGSVTMNGVACTSDGACTVLDKTQGHNTGTFTVVTPGTLTVRRSLSGGAASTIGTLTIVDGTARAVAGADVRRSGTRAAPYTGTGSLRIAPTGAPRQGERAANETRTDVIVNGIYRLPTTAGARRPAALAAIAQGTMAARWQRLQMMAGAKVGITDVLGTGHLLLHGTDGTLQCVAFDSTIGGTTYRFIGGTGSAARLRGTMTSGPLGFAWGGGGDPYGSRLDVEGDAVPYLAREAVEVEASTASTSRKLPKGCRTLLPHLPRIAEASDDVSNVTG
jgi:hypothetical protein